MMRAAMRIGLALSVGFLAQSVAAQEPHWDFDREGVQEGQRLSDVEAYTLEGEPTSLSALWDEKPVLLVTSSLTCPVARQRWPELGQLTDRYGDEVNVAVLYTIEAHPSKDPSPYTGEEWVTQENRREGILHRQPTSLLERLALAREFQERLGISVPILVDGMEDQGWQDLGRGPNLAILVRPGGRIAAKQGWFDGRRMERSIQAMLDSLERAR